MTDLPPPTDKKPRRRSAPRKRSSARPAPQVEAAKVDATIDAAASVPAAMTARDGSTASTPDNLADRLDPKPLVDSGDRGDAPASDSPLAAPAERRGRRQPRTKREKAAPPPAAAASPVEAAGDVNPVVAVTDAQPVQSGAPSPAAVQDAAGAAFPRQAELRPGELIRVPLSVRWRDLDAFNHVNNSKYLSYLEEARLRWMLAMPGMGMDDHVAPVVAASSLNYRRPIAWPGDVVIELFVERIGGSSLTIGHRIVDSKDGGTLYCDGNVVMVWIDRDSGRSAPLPESVRAACR